ncbi:DUF5719 family protein [Alloscardovia omnicolens]|uniref:DUF5719 family protein n=1 Tax=Alloscardovia omnicolens TaxID=419015 RepID=UPI003A685AE4
MSTAHKVLTITGATVSAVALVGACAMLVSGVMQPSFMTYDQSLSASTVHDVAQVNSAMYCPARMKLADTEHYGDADFQASAGDITSTSRVGLMGAIYQAQTESINHQDTAALLDNKTMHSGDVHTHSTDASAPTVISSRTLTAQKFTGTAGTVVSWASQADLRGISAAACVPFASTQSFLIPPTTTGWSQQLIVANSSDKPTSIRLTAYGSASSSELAMETHATAAIAAHSETVVDLSAAFDVNDGAYVRVDSDAAAVTGVIQAVHMNGLVPQGSDYIVPLNKLATQQVIPAAGGAMQTRLYVYSDTDGSARITFLGQNGEISHQEVTYKAHQLSAQHFDTLPQGTQSVMIDSTSQVAASLYGQSAATSDGQSDFSMTPAQSAQSAFAVPVPDNVGVTLDVSNNSGASRDVQILAFNADGQQVGKRDLTVSSHSVELINGTDFGNSVALLQISQKSKGASALVVGASFSVDAVNKAQVASRATVAATSMELATAQYKVTNKRALLN